MTNPTSLDGHVRIWSTEAILNTGDPQYESKPKQLASLSYHSGTIHSVRFSPNGKYLASGADDKIVCIYILDPNPPSHTTFGRSKSRKVGRSQYLISHRLERDTTCRELADIPTSDWARQRCTRSRMVSRFFDIGVCGSGLEGCGLVGAYI